jgi:hypothetical protein
MHVSRLGISFKHILILSPGMWIWSADWGSDPNPWGYCLQTCQCHLHTGDVIEMHGDIISRHVNIIHRLGMWLKLVGVLCPSMEMWFAHQGCDPNACGYAKGYYLHRC